MAALSCHPSPPSHPGHSARFGPSLPALFILFQLLIGVCKRVTRGRQGLKKVNGGAVDLLGCLKLAVLVTRQFLNVYLQTTKNKACCLLFQGACIQQEFCSRTRREGRVGMLCRHFRGFPAEQFVFSVGNVPAQLNRSQCGASQRLHCLSCG